MKSQLIHGSNLYKKKSYYLASFNAVNRASLPPRAALSSITAAMCGANQPAACLASIDCKTASKLGHCKARTPDDALP